jgi:hypothetical protein
MTTTVLAGAWVTGTPTADVVLSEHAPIQPGGHACRACGHVYSDELPVCPAALAASAGYPAAAERLQLVEVDGRLTPVEALRVDQERLASRLAAL